MSIYERFYKIENCLTIPLIFGSVFVTISQIIQIIETNLEKNSFETVFLNFSDLLILILPYIFCYYFTVFANNGKKWLIGSWSVICLAIFSTAFQSISNTNINYIFGLLIAFIVYYVFNHFENKIAFFGISITLSLILGLAIGYLYEYFNDFNMFLSQFISNKGILSSALFGAINTFYSLFDCTDFSNMIFYKSYGGSMLINEEIVTGVKDLLEAGYSGKLLSTYLSGHYYLLFGIVGVGISMLPNIKGIHRITLVTLLVCSVISGNFSFVLLFILLQCPWLFVSVIIVSALAYVSAYVIDLGSGYLLQGGIIEMFLYPGNAVYLLAGGTVFIALGYFVYKYCFEKYGISDCYNIYFPTRLIKTVDALGGIRNIVRFKDGCVEVRNPQLVNNMSFDCEINENLIKYDCEEIAQLKEYFDENKGRTF